MPEPHSIHQKRKSSTTRTQSLRAEVIWNHIETAFRIPLIEVGCRRNHSLHKCEHSSDGLESARCSQRVTVHRFGGAQPAQHPRNTDWIAAVSVGSFAAVPVPCALT